MSCSFRRWALGGHVERLDAVSHLPFQDHTTQPAGASQDNNLGTGLGDRCRGPQGRSGLLNLQLEESHKGA
jgi:hypothetical protein